MIRFTFPLTILLLMISGCQPDITSCDFKHETESTSEWHELSAGTLAGVEYSFLVQSESFQLGQNVAQIRFGSALPAGATLSYLIVSNDNQLVDLPAGGVLNSSLSQSDDDPNLWETSFMLLPDSPTEINRNIWIELENNGESHRIEIPVTELGTERAKWNKAGTFVLDWITPEQPEVGQNMIENVIFSQNEGLWSQLSTANIEFYPYMDMGGGTGHSAPHIDPESSENGVYSGSVDFIMSGGWDLYFYVNQAGQADTISFRNFIVNP